LVARSDDAGFVLRWHGLRLVAADASTLRCGLRASTLANAASAEQIAFDYAPQIQEYYRRNRVTNGHSTDAEQDGEPF
jgi:hypothetical protein